ncbi:hypothetical protein SAMN05421678_10434 [Actinopolymorpha cephalotaxi]|uniref:Uncharacterized protein n=1 Tax=Actinopolymorpha cephalotaxi TaxID=504797 RepID=A0A1I2PF36_9ACTN|nr:hypothetical protein [Actinopolymorpha cephalotaxi]NYH83714.1 hypothetical protein [Actinopolymorpha cephalotaxi]SFG12266.1 hypothetical protein SAMN05421678_10434 [Actinopolymorpha cephalotaxi]
MKRRLAQLVASVLAGFLVLPVAAASAGGGRKLLSFDEMAPVTEPYTGAANAVRAVPGGGLPWEIESAHGELRSDGRVQVTVEGLVLARRAPVPSGRQGTNPVPAFKAVVSCMSTSQGAATTVNVATATAPATPDGDAVIKDRIDLPSPCLAPIVFVTSPDGAWFAVTGQ